MTQARPITVPHVPSGHSDWLGAGHLTRSWANHSPPPLRLCPHGPPTRTCSSPANQGPPQAKCNHCTSAPLSSKSLSVAFLAAMIPASRRTGSKTLELTREAEKTVNPWKGALTVFNASSAPTNPPL